jgi:hypothetical protein
MAFDFSYMDKRDSVPSEVQNEPIVKIWNNKDNNRKNSYFFLNKHAVALLNGADRVRVGIDTETKKIVITPSKDNKGRQLSKMSGGSATIALKALIEENDLPTKEFVVGFLQSYAHGGIIFSYDEE